MNRITRHRNVPEAPQVTVSAPLDLRRCWPDEDCPLDLGAITTNAVRSGRPFADAAAQRLEELGIACFRAAEALSQAADQLDRQQSTARWPFRVMPATEIVPRLFPHDLPHDLAGISFGHDSETRTFTEVWETKDGTHVGELGPIPDGLDACLVSTLGHTDGRMFVGDREAVARLQRLTDFWEELSMITEDTLQR